MNEQIDARTILVTETPMLPMLPDKPEPVHVEPTKLTKAQVLKRLGWSEDDFEAAQSHAFPPAGKRISPHSYGWTLIWQDVQIDTWLTDMRQKIDVMQRLIGAKAKR